MKTIKNVQTTMQKGKLSNMLYSDLIVACTNFLKPNVGITSENMGKRIRIIDAVKNINVGKVIELEDADAALLKKLSEEMQWAIVHEDIATFGAAIKRM